LGDFGALILAEAERERERERGRERERERERERLGANLYKCFSLFPKPPPPAVAMSIHAR